MISMVARNQTQNNTIFYANRYSQGLLATKGKKNCSEIARATNVTHDRVQRDLEAMAEDPAEIRSSLLSTVIQKNKMTAGFLICDGTLLVKEFAEEMEGVSYQHSGSTTKPGIGVMATVWTNLEDTYAVDAFTWQRGDPSKIQTATRKLISLTQQIGAKGVINDAAFASIEAIRAYNEANVAFLMRFHSNRVVFVPGFENYGNMPIHEHPAFKMKRNKRYIIRKIVWHGQKFYAVAVKIEHSTKGWIRLFLATTMKLKDAKKIAELYKHRWKVEVFFRTCKQTYGLGDCLARSLKKQEAHCLASLLAYNAAKIEPVNICDKLASPKITGKYSPIAKPQQRIMPIPRSTLIFDANA